MTAELVPYLQFATEAGDALALYQSVFGGEVEKMTFAEQGGMGVPEAQQHLVMHAALQAPGVHVYVCDVPAAFGEPHVNGAMALSGSDTPTLRRWWEGLAATGRVDVPLEKAEWGDLYGQLQDQFGIDWMFNVADDGLG